MKAFDLRELTVQGNNDTLNLENRQAIAAEVRQQLDNFLQLANTRDANGPIFPIGDVDPRLPVHEDVIGVITSAGPRALTRMLCGAHSNARALVISSTAPLVAQ